MSSLVTFVSGIPAIEGWYPRASSKELRIQKPRKTLVKKLALVTTSVMLADVFSSIRRRRMSFSTPFLRSTRPVLLCRRVGRGRYWIPFTVRKFVNLLRSYSSSADTRLGAPWWQIHTRSNADIIVSTLRLAATRASV